MAAFAVICERAAALSPRGLGLGGGKRHLAFFPVGAHLDGFAGLNLALQDFERQRVLDEALDGALERTRSELRIVAALKEQLACRRRELDNDLAVSQQSAQVVELQVND